MSLLLLRRLLALISEDLVDPGDKVCGILVLLSNVTTALSGGCHVHHVSSARGHITTFLSGLPLHLFTAFRQLSLVQTHEVGLVHFSRLHDMIVDGVGKSLLDVVTTLEDSSAVLLVPLPEKRVSMQLI